MIGPADRDELRDRLAETLADIHDQIADQGREGCWLPAGKAADALLPLIDEHTAAAVVAERERIAAAIEAQWPTPDNFDGVSLIESAAWACAQQAARIAREEPADGNR